MPKSQREKNPSTHTTAYALERQDVNCCTERKASISPDDQPREPRQLPGVTISSPSGNSSPAPVGRKIRPTGPKIVIDEDITGSTSPELSRDTTTLHQEHTESDDGDDHSMSSAGSSADGLLLPTSFRYALSVTCLGRNTNRKENCHLNWNDRNSYRDVETSAIQLAKETIGETDEGVVVTFRYGFCTISKRKADIKRRLTLISQEDCRRLCKIMVTEYGFGSDREYDLVIHREYFELRIRPDDTELEAFEDVKHWELDNLMKTNIDDKKFISSADLQKYTSDGMVRAIVMHHSCWGPSPNKDEIEGLVQNILQKKARKLLALCVYARVSMKCLKELIEADHRYDDDLPSSLRKCCLTHRKRPYSLVHYHGIFQAAVFNTPGEYQQMSNSIVAPIIPVDADGDETVTADISSDSENDSKTSIFSSQPVRDRAMIGYGSHGWVFRVRIDPYHHKLSNDRDAEFALKEFKASGSDVKFGRESEIMQLLRQYSNPHLTTHLVMWTHRGRYFLLFPLAKCNLHEYMKRNAFEHTKENQIWLLEQFYGLANALQRIHDLSFRSSDANLSPNPSQQEMDRIAGWHHDLKPENILYFEDADPKRKTLQIADFGSSKIHIIRSRSHPTRTPRGTLTYEPPEMEIEGQTSRPYDVWSLGCVFLEMLVWAMMGFTALENFKKERFCKRTFEGVHDDGFWEKRPNGIVTLRDSVQQWILKLQKKVEDQPHQPFKELLDLVTYRMLEIDRMKRVFADGLSLDTERILVSKKVVLRQGSSAIRHDDKGSEVSPVTLLPHSSLFEPSRRSSTAPSFSDASLSPFRNPTLITDVDHSTASPIDHISPHTTSAHLRRNSVASELNPSPVIRSRAPSNASTSGHSPLNPNASRIEALSPTNLKPPSSPRRPSGSRPTSSHSASGNIDEERP